MKKHTAGLIYFGLGGHVVEMEPRDNSTSTLSGYDSPELFLWELARGKYAEGYIMPQACPVIDKRAILEAAPRFAWRSPLVDMRKPHGAAVDRFADVARSSIVADALRDDAAQGNGFAQIIRYADAVDATKPEHEPGPLDTIDRAAYVEWWRRAGARVGALQFSPDGAPFILWSDGSETHPHNPHAEQWRKAGNL